MLYVCSCGFTAETATAFYKHLAESKESGEGHQLIQARFSEKHNKGGAKVNEALQGSVQQAPAAASWVDEYLMVDQRDTGAHGSASGRVSPLPVSSGTLEPPLQHPASESGMEDVPLKDLQSLSRGWGSLGRQRSSAARPPPPVIRGSSVTAAAEAAAKAKPLASDEVELIEPIRNTRTSNPGVGIDAGASGSGGTAAQAALRMSGSVVSAMVVGLSPWKWFGNGAAGGSGPHGNNAEAGSGVYTGPAARADPYGTPVGNDDSGSDLGVDAMEGDAALQQHGGLGLDPPVASLEAVHAVRDVLIWRNPWRTGRVFGAGLYLAVCVRQLTKGHDLLQPSTAIFGLCFFLLLRNVIREAAATYRRTQQHQQQQSGLGQLPDGPDGAPSQSPLDEDVERRKAAMLLQQRLEVMLQPVAVGAARYGAALVVLGAGLMSGRRAITSALVAALLWLGMVLGELRLISQPMFWLLCYVAAFTIPAAYYRCRHAMDASVEAALRFVVRVLVSGSRTTLFMAAGVAAVLVAVLPLNLVLRASLAAAGAFGVLLWKSEFGGQPYVGGAPGQGQLAGGHGLSRLLAEGSQGRAHGD